MRMGRKVPIFVGLAVISFCILTFFTASIISDNNQSGIRSESGSSTQPNWQNNLGIADLIPVLLLGSMISIALGLLMSKFVRDEILAALGPLSKTIAAPEGKPDIQKNRIDLTSFTAQVKNLHNEFIDLKQSLRSAEEKYLTLADNIPTGFAVIDRDGRIKEANRKMKEWFPSIGDSHNGKFSELMLQSQLNQSLMMQISQASENGLIYDGEAILLTSKGLRFFSITSTPSIGSDGELKMVALWFNDISARLLAENELEQKCKELSVLNEIISVANLSKTLGSLCKNVIESIARKMDFDYGGLYLIEEDPVSAKLTYRKGAPLFSMPDKLDLQDQDHPAAKAAMQKEPIFENNCAESDSVGVMPDYRALVIVPLIYLDKSIGVMYFANSAAREFSGNDKLVLLNVIREVGNALAMALAREALEKSEKEYRGLFENANDIIFMMDLRGDLTFANRKAQDFVGYNKEDIKHGLNIFRLLTQQSYRQALERMRILVGGVEIDKSFIIEVVKKNGNYAFLEYKAWLIHSENRPVGVQCIARDITGRLESEEKLRKSEEMYRALVESSQDMIFSLDKDYRYQYFHGYDKFDFSPDQVIGRTPHDFMDNKTANLWIEKAKEAFKKNKTMRFEGEVQRDGEHFWLSTTFSPIRNAEGRVVAALGISRDYTAQKRIELELSRKKLFLESLLRSTHDIIITADNDRKIVFANEALEASLGYNPVNAIGKSIAFLFRNASEIDDIKQEILDSLKRDGFFKGELELKHADGRLVPMEVSLAPIKSPDGQKPGIVASLRDITDRQKMQEELRRQAQDQKETIEALQMMQSAMVLRSEELRKISSKLSDEKAFTDSVLSSIEQWVRVIDINGNPLFVNKSMREALGDLADNVCYALFEGKERCKECIGRKAIITGQTVSREVSVNGRIYFKVCSPIINDDGEITKAVELIQDITETKLIQQQVIQSSKMASIGTLAAGIAHEFRNLLGGITGNASYALTILDDKKEIEGVLSEILDISSSADNIATSLLTFSHQPGGQVTDVDLNHLVETTINLIGKELNGHKIEFESGCEPLRQVRGNPAELQQALMNLLTNAIEASAKTGKVMIRGKNEKDQVLLSVEDSGCGISEENLSRIFDPFFSTKGVWGDDPGEGLGLGLTIAKNIAEEYGGRIYVESEAKKGSRFTISLPAINPLTKRSNIETFFSSLKPMSKIAVFEPDDDLKSELQTMASHYGFRTLFFSDASEIFSSNEDQHFDALLLDANSQRIMDFARAFEEAVKAYKDIIIGIISDGRVNFELQDYFEQADFVLIRPFGLTSVKA